LKSSLAEHRDLLAQRDDQLVALRQSMERLESRQDALETTATKPPGRRPKPS
jgi:uncharacterized coiled-coil protein SlyX